MAPLLPMPEPKVRWFFPTTSFEELEASLSSARSAIDLAQTTMNSGRRDKEGTKVRVLGQLRDAAKGVQMARPTRPKGE